MPFPDLAGLDEVERLDVLWQWVEDHEPGSPPEIAAHVAVAEVEAGLDDASGALATAENLMTLEGHTW
ncbi:hypothetical protein MF406_10740 [Georgenia sp. TF02-10]|uniref:hypothetical protein n=1 Tax=Georgenia sp. TF02-10 TaxID=2917725 RepID=UPI001FA70BE3|nr:hypothetical protein [Georgenia sp. TF02-10]UNX53474.1 hypothetical protein MF406_10740 [Georgenia sp. TF02-10]